MLKLTGVETNNLQSIDVAFSHGELTAIVGGSGAGKTSLAFHSLYALCKNELDTISGVSASLRPVVHAYENLLPAVSLRQKNTNVNPRSSIFTYLGLDKLFLPLFMRANPGMRRNFMAQNAPDNYCPTCQGLGVIIKPDAKRIVDYSKPLSAHPFLSWNNFLAAYYYPLLEQFCAAHGIAMSKSLDELPASQRDLLLNSSGNEVYLVKYKQKTRYRQKKIPFIGAIREIEDCCNNLQQPGNRQKAKSYILEQPCPQCRGARFAPQLQQFKLKGWTVQDIMAANFDALSNFICSLPDKDFAIHRLATLFEHIIKNNLGYLAPMRSIPSLSGGEFQRLQLAAILSADFCNLLYVVDEASSSLHVAEYANVIKQIEALKKKPATVVIVEHKLEFIEKADRIIALENGNVVDEVAWLREQKAIAITRTPVAPSGSRDFSVKAVNNISELSAAIPMGCLVGCCGVSGSGKSSFAEAISSQKNVSYINQSGIHGNSNSTVGTYLKLMQPLDSFLGDKLGTASKTFLFNNEGSQCSNCMGKGFVELEAAYGHTFRYPCDVCNGQRYNQHVLAHSYMGYSIHDILTMPIAQLVEGALFKESAVLTSKFKDMLSIGLGHLNLFRATSELSGGEAQRIRLLSQIKANLKKTFLIVDEPSRGLEKSDSKLLLDFLDSLLPSTQGIMVIEHNVFLLKHMDYIVEFGPGGGDRGGNIIYQGSISAMQNSNSVIKDYICNI